MKKFFSAISRFLYNIVKVASWFCMAFIAVVAAILLGGLLAAALVWSMAVCLVIVVVVICAVPFIFMAIQE